MKKILNCTKRFAFIVALVLLYHSASACANGGKIRVDTSRCDILRAKLWLVNHAPVAGRQYFWQSSNDGGLSWGTMATNSGQDTQLVNILMGRMYRCYSICGATVAYSDTLTLFLQNRTITVDQVFCSGTAGGNDSLLLKVGTQNPATDTSFAKNFKWQVSNTNGILWSDIGGNSPTLKVRFTANVLQYRAYVTFCRLTGAPSTYPTGQPSFVQPVDIGLNNIGLTITNKDCVNDTARIGLTNTIQTLANFLKYRWSDSNQVSGVYSFMGSTDSFVKVKVDNMNRFYRTSVKLCNTPFPSLDSFVTKPYVFWVKLGSLVPVLNCTSETVELDYANRNQARRSVHTYWTRSENDSLNHTNFTDPADSVKYSFPLLNGTNYFFKVYSKFCDISSNILDSSFNVNVKLKIDTGQLKGSFQTCTNDSVYLRLLNYKDSSSFPLVKKWMILKNGSNFWEDYTTGPQTDTTIVFRMSNGLNTYRKSMALCSDKYAKKWSSTLASTFLPYQAIYQTVCAGTMNLNVLNDTVRITDYTGVIPRNNTTFGYQWLRSTNKIGGTIIAGANGANLTIAQADRGAFFKRLTRICSANTFSDTTNWSNTSVGAPSVQNGSATVTNQICLNETVRICVDNFSPHGTDTPTYVWQYSPNDINWSNMNTVNSNDTCITAIVTSGFQYYRRLTYWCPSGRVDSTRSARVNYIKTLPWLESFTGQTQFGRNIVYNCWRSAIPVCNSYSQFLGGRVYSEIAGGKSDKHISNWGPESPSGNPDVQKTPPNARRNDLKLITPAFDLKRGKHYRFSFWNREDASNLCWDSLYVTWGTSPAPCDMTNKFGELLTKFSFDQWNKFWSDFSPPDDGSYYFAINLRDKDATTGEIKFDEVGLKEIESCEGKSPRAGTTFAPSKIIDRSEEPNVATNYDKSRVTHQYCLWDTIMLTYQEANFESNFDYHGMKYQFYRKRSDQDWKVEDTFFRPVLGDTLCHITNRSDYHVMNVVVTDTHTWYKIVATCQYDGKQFHADSLLVNGTHGVPYCEDWESVGPIRGNQPPVSALAPPRNGNSGQIIGRVPSFSFCPTCWAAFPQPNENIAPLPAPAPSAADISFCSATLPFQNLLPGQPPLVPQLSPDGGYFGPTVVMSTDNRNPAPTARKVLVMPAVRLYKGRGYRISFRWTDNRNSTQSPWGSVSQDIDSLYLVATKGNRCGRTIDSFRRSKMVPNGLQLNLQSNILENGQNKYRTYWVDYTPSDTGTYYFGIVTVLGAANGNPYRFYMDYFCIDTLDIDDCSQQPKFTNPLRVKVSPDGKEWKPGDTEIVPAGVQWCVGNRINLELDFGLSSFSSWKHGWKHYWQRTTMDYVALGVASNHPSIIWTTIDSSNGINYLLTTKFQDYRLILANSCKTKFDTVGPFRVIPFKGTPSCVVGLRETFKNDQFNNNAVLPQCWDVYPSCRVRILDDNGTGNEFKQMAKLDKNYLDMDFITPASAACPMPGVQTFVPPGYTTVKDTVFRFSFWYKDNGISVPIDSIVAGFSYSRPTDAFQFRLVNRMNNDVVKNSRTNKWRYYTTELTTPADTAVHFKVKTFNLGTKRIYRTMFDDLLFKKKLGTDALVIAIDSPDCKCDLTANTTVKVSVMNIGKNTLNNLPLKVQVGTKTPTAFTVAGSLASNEVKTVYVPNVDLSDIGDNEIKAWTEAPGEEFTCDDTFTSKIYHQEMPPKPTDTIDSVCICSNHTMTAPYNNARWYRNGTDFTPLLNGGSFTMDSVCKDTSIFYSQWNGDVCNTIPPNFSFGAPTYSAALGGIAFDNISKDTILIDSVMVYANTISPGPTLTIRLTQFQGAQTVTLINATVPGITRLGRQWIPIKIKIPPGTDYKLIYGGGAALAQLPGFIFIGAGCNLFDINFLGDENYPAGATAYKYFFNWKLIKLGCETERVKKDLIVVPSPKFQLKDTTRVCSQPVYKFCGPAAPAGEYYKYQWASSLPNDTNQCKDVKTTGWYRLTVTNTFGCAEFDSTEVIVDPSPEFSLGSDTSFCRFTPYTLSAFKPSIFPREVIDTANNLVTWSDNQAGVSIKVLNPGTYVATAYNTQNFCTAKDTINLIRHDLPVFSLGNDRAFCGAGADLQALAPNLPTNLNYTWSPPAPFITGSGTYWVEGFDPTTNCKTRDTIVANMQPIPVLQLGDDIVACGSVYTIANAPGGNLFYKWNTTATTRTLAVSTPGTYYLTVTDKTYGCQAVDSVKVSFKSVPTFDLGPDVVKCATTHPINGPTPPAGVTYNYRWKKPGSNYVVGTSSFPANESGVYYLRVDNDCYDFTDSIRITLKTPPDTAINMLKDTTGCKKANLRATSTTTYTSIVWTGPVGSAVNGSTANLVQADSTGTYSVSLTNECGTASKAAYVRIDDLPVANFNVGYLDSLNDCMSIVLDNKSQNGITYLWSFGDGNTSADERPLHVYTQEGSYLVTLKAYNACGFSSRTVAIKKRDVRCSTLGINGQNLSSTDIYIFPNPARDNTQILGVGLPNGKYKLSIKNLLGQTVFENEIKVIGNEVSEKIEISKFANGEYLIELSNDIESIVRKLQVVK
jgi:hypothetical protein